jgi:hypothetical protein
VEDVRPVLVDQDAGIVQMVERVAAMCGRPINHQHLLAGVIGQPFCHDGTGEARADHHTVVVRDGRIMLGE